MRKCFPKANSSRFFTAKFIPMMLVWSLFCQQSQILTLTSPVDINVLTGSALRFFVSFVSNSNDKNNVCKQSPLPPATEAARNSNTRLVFFLGIHF